MMEKPADDWKKRLSAMDQFVFKRVLVLFMGIVMGVGLILSASRGGIISASLGLMTMALLLLFKKEHRRKSLVLLCLFLGILVYGLSVGMDYTVKQLDSPLLEPVSRCLCEPDPSGKIISCQQAVIYALEQSAMRNPFVAYYHLLLGWEYTRVTPIPDLMRIWLPAADAAMKRAEDYVKKYYPNEAMEWVG